MTRERCEICDREDCPRPAADRAYAELGPRMIDESYAMTPEDCAVIHEAYRAGGNCHAHAVDWRQRAIAAEALLRHARLYVAAYWNSDAPMDKRDAAGDVYRAIVEVIAPKDAALRSPAAGEGEGRR